MAQVCVPHEESASLIVNTSADEEQILGRYSLVYKYLKVKKANLLLSLASLVILSRTRQEIQCTKASWRAKRIENKQICFHFQLGFGKDILSVNDHTS